MSFTVSRVLATIRSQLSGVTMTAPGVLIPFSTRLYPSTKSTFRHQEIHNISHSPDHIQSKMPPRKLLRNANRFLEFDLEGRVFAVTGGGRGLGLSIAEALIEAGAKGKYLVL